MDIRLKDFDDGYYPRRRPWLIVIVVAVLIGLVFLIRSGCGGKEQPQGESLKLRHPGDKEAVAATVSSSKSKSEVPARKAVSTTSKVRSTESKSSAKAQVATPPPSQGTKDIDLLNEGRAREDRGDLLSARQIYLDILNRYPQGTARREVEKRLGTVSMSILLTPCPSPEKVAYSIRPGDRVEAIAKKFGTTPELVARGNQLPNGNMIRVGDELRVFTGKFSLSISKSRHEMVVYMNGAFCKSYPVSVGAYDKTPIGEFVLTLKQENPVWYIRSSGEGIPFGDPRNILGTRWMAIKDAADPKSDRRGLGIHGTNDDSTIGKSVSAGCIRMMNRDVEELYCLLPIGVKVSIAE